MGAARAHQGLVTLSPGTSDKRVRRSYRVHFRNNGTQEQKPTWPQSQGRVEWASLPGTGTLESAGHWNAGTSARGGWVKLGRS